MSEKGGNTICDSLGRVRRLHRENVLRQIILTPKLSDPAHMKAKIATKTPPPGSLKRMVRRTATI
jgi:hypothetical protein